MKIIILSPSVSLVGGVERFCAYLSSVYRKAGHEAIIISGRSESSLISKFFVKVGLGVPFIGWQLGREARRQKFDVVVTNGLLGWNLKQKNIINIQHGTFAAAADRIDRSINWPKWLMKKYIWGYFEGLAARRANQVVAVSLETAANVKKYYHVADVAVINNAIDTEVFIKLDQRPLRQRLNLPIDKKLALFVGRFEYGKGSDIIKKCLPILAEHDYSLVAATDRKIIGENVISLLDLVYVDMPALYSACDLFIFPSRHEGCSLALLEAMSCELPFLTAPVGSADEIRILAPALRPWICPLEDFSICLRARLESDHPDLDLAVRERQIILSHYNPVKFAQEYLALLSNLSDQQSK